MKLSFVISTQPTQFQAVAFDPNLDANVARLAQLGYSGVELAVRDPSKLDVAAVKRTLNQYHLQVPAIGTGQAYVEEHLSFTDPEASIREQALTRIQSHIELAHELGAVNVIASREAAKQSPTKTEIASSQNPLLAMTSPVVIVGLIRGKVQPNVSRDQAHTWLVESMKRVAQVANERGVRVVIEPINRYETDLVNNVPEALTLIEEIGMKNVGVLFDTFHANIEEPRIEIGLMVCRSHLFHIHIADSNRWYPGAGHTDFGRVMATLRAMKYDGWVSAEILPKPEMLHAAEQTMRTMKDFFK